MQERFVYKHFRECDLNDEFFDSLKTDYPEFSDWFRKKSNAQAYVYMENEKIQAFGYLKEECEEIVLRNAVLPAENRIKMGTLKIGEDLQGQRRGEGLLGIALWSWQASASNQIYVTVFLKHVTLVNLLEKFGFCDCGENQRGEHVFIKDKRQLNHNDPYKMFPYISGTFDCAKYIPIEEKYHDTLFPYSALKRTKQSTLNMAVANGISKIYIGTPRDTILNYKKNNPVLIYRIAATGQKTFRSVVSSYGTVVQYEVIKKNYRTLVSEKEFVQAAGNKSFFCEEKLLDLYRTSRNLMLIELLYNGFFGEGHNVNHYWLKNAGYFDTYPYNIDLPPDAFRKILREGGKNEQDIILN
jgi:hypothetical protein